MYAFYSKFTLCQPHRPETTLSSLTKHLAKFRVELKKLSDVEIVRHNFDKDETDRLVYEGVLGTEWLSDQKNHF